MAVVPVCTQQFVTLEHCFDRWLSNNARFKCEPKAAFSDFFFFFFTRTCLWSAWLTKKLVCQNLYLGPSPFSLTLLLEVQFLHGKPGSKAVLQTSSRIRLCLWLTFLPTWRRSPSHAPAAAQPLSCRKPWEGACRFSAALKCLQSELAQHLQRTA